jgi:hypothetical protein
MCGVAYERPTELLLSGRCKSEKSIRNDGHIRFPNTSIIIKTKRSKRQGVDRPLSNQQVFRKVFYIAGTISADGSGNIGGVNFTSDLVRSTPAPDWASFVTFFSLFRVIRMKFNWSPVVCPANNTLNNGLIYVAGTAAAVNPSSTVASDTYNFYRPKVSLALIFDRPVTYSVTGRDVNPESLVYSSTVTAIPTSDLFGISMRANGLLASALYYDYDIEFEVEFKTSS